MANKTLGFANSEIQLVDTGQTVNGSPIYAIGVSGSSGPGSSASTPQFTEVVPTTDSAAAPSSNQTSAAAGSLILKAAPGNLYGLECSNGASAGYLMLFDAITAPADGTVTPKRVYAMATNSSFARSFNPPIRCGTGMTLVFSTTGPFTKTASATAFLAGDYV